MSKRLTIWFLSLGIIPLLFYSCLPDPLEVEGVPTIKPQIVVSSQILTDQSLVVLLTKSFGALDASDDSDPQALLNQIAINDALVTITGPQGTDTLNFIDTGFYGGLTSALEGGKSYTLQVKSPTMGEVSASTVVKPQVRFDQIESELFFNGFDDTLAQITHQFQDLPGKNYYMLNVQRFRQQNLEEQLLNPRAFIRLLTDEAFDGKLHSETFRVFPTDFSEGDTVAVYLSNISEEYYRFVKLRVDNRFSFVEFLGEPINYPSNVTGGKGFFNLYLPDIRVFRLSAK
jgi:Domain of unknown function (DUF4249)